MFKFTEPIYNRMLCDSLFIDEDENEMMGVDEIFDDERKDVKDHE